MPSIPLLAIMGPACHGHFRDGKVMDQADHTLQPCFGLDTRGVLGLIIGCNPLVRKWSTPAIQLGDFDTWDGPPHRFFAYSLAAKHTICF